MEYFTTDIGILRRDSVAYLVNQGVLFFENSMDRYVISGKSLHMSEIPYPVNKWSVFCLLLEDIKKTYNLKKNNTAIGYMRNKSLNIDQRGRVLAVQHYEMSKRGGSKRQQISFD